jgi:hypothetical protein
LLLGDSEGDWEDVLASEPGAEEGEGLPILGMTKIRRPTSAKMLRMAEAYRGGMSLAHFDGAKVQAPMICKSRK